MNKRIKWGALSFLVIALAVYAVTNTQVDNADATNLDDYELIMGVGSELSGGDDITALTLNQKFTMIKTKLDSLQGSGGDRVFRLKHIDWTNSISGFETIGYIKESFFTERAEYLNGGQVLTGTLSTGTTIIPVNGVLGRLNISNQSSVMETRENYTKFGFTPPAEAVVGAQDACVFTPTPGGGYLSYIQSSMSSSRSIYGVAYLVMSRGMNDAGYTGSGSEAIALIQDANDYYVAFAIYPTEGETVDAAYCAAFDAGMAYYGYSDTHSITSVDVELTPAEPVENIRNVLQNQVTTKTDCLSKNAMWFESKSLNTGAYSSFCSLQTLIYGMDDRIDSNSKEAFWYQSDIDEIEDFRTLSGY